MSEPTSTLSNGAESMFVKNPCLKQSNEKLYEDREETGDVVFSVGTEVILAHRCILAAISSKYKAQFYGPMPKEDPITVANVSPAAFNEFLQFFYVENVELTIENIEDVLDLAKQSLVNEFVDECVKFLLHAVPLEKVCWCYRLAISYDIKTLQEFCEEQISVNIKAVFKTSDFLDCNRDLLRQILSLDTLNCTETEVFNACISWACNKSVEAKIISKWRSELGDAFYEIRFYSMTFLEFTAIHKSFSELLSMDESYEIYHCIGGVQQGEKFNTKPRTPKTIVSTTLKNDLTQIIRVKRSLCCRTATNTRGNFRDENEKLSFICDHTIYLNGFNMCNKIEESFSVHIEFGTKILPKHAYMIQYSDNNTKVIFYEPLKIRQNERCFISVKFKQFRLSQLYGYYVLDETKQNDVWFQFPNPSYDNRRPRLITHLWFDHLYFAATDPTLITLSSSTQ